MARYLSTMTPLGNGRYPSMNVTWTEDADSNGWTGEATFWADANTPQPPAHRINLRQGQPLGSISVTTDGTEHGAWSMTSFEGTGLTERDLQWAAAYAMETLKRKRNFSLTAGAGVR